MAAVTSRENVVCSHVETVLSFFLSISQILVLPDITDVKVLNINTFLSFFSAHFSSHASHVFYHAYCTSHGHYLGSHRIVITESRPRSRPWHRIFFPQELC